MFRFEGVTIRGPREVEPLPEEVVDETERACVQPQTMCALHALLENAFRRVFKTLREVWQRIFIRCERDGTLVHKWEERASVVFQVKDT